MTLDPEIRFIGTVAVSHGAIGPEMVRIARSIVVDPAPMVGIALEHDEAVDRIRQKIRSAIVEVDRGNGILILTDMFGGTPSNISLPFLEEGKVEVITGMNLPMLIKMASLRGEKNLSDVALFLRDYGQKNIALAGQILRKTE
jgi:PTS system mannose-specific IIA component